MRHHGIPVACIQTRAHDRADFERAWPRIVTSIEEAGRLGAKLIVLPEGTVPGYVLGDEPVSSEQLERAARRVAELARQYDTTIVYGSARHESGRTYNAAIAVGPDGRVLGHAAKQFLWHFDRRWFAPGVTLEPIDSPLGKLGLLVCADGRIPTIAATLVERGAQLLVMPTAWVTSGRDPQVLENLQADLMANVRARENGVPFVIANKCGVEHQSVAYCGKSAIIDAEGTFVARGSERDEEIVFGHIVTTATRSSVTVPAAQNVAMSAAHSAGPLRIAFTVARDGALPHFATLAADADANLVLARSASAGVPGEPSVLDVSQARAHCDEASGVRLVTVSTQTFRAPAGLVRDRLSGCDLFVWHADGDRSWNVAYARTRAAELRAYVVVFEDEERAFAVDPDGAIVAGTFGDFRMATFAYDRARSAATKVAPTTDVLDGLIEADRIRSLARPEDFGASAAD